MTVQASVFLTPAATASAHREGDYLWLNVQTDDTSASQVTLHLGGLSGGDQRGDQLRQLRMLADVILEARQLLGDDLEPEPGPDDPTDEPTDDPELVVDGRLTFAGAEYLLGEPADVPPGLTRADMAWLESPRSAAPCLYCGHPAGHAPVQGAGCEPCNQEAPLGACHGVAALADAAYRAMAARIAPESPTELAMANGDR